MPWRFKDDAILPVKSAFKVNSGQMAKAAAIRGLGFALLPVHACGVKIRKGLLTSIELEQQPEDLVLYALYSGRQYPLEKVKVFLAFLKEQIRHYRVT